MIASFNISINDDNVFEINENFTLTTFSFESFTFGHQAIVVIVDNDGECLLISSLDSSLFILI